MSYIKKIQSIIFIVFIFLLFSIAHKSFANRPVSLPTGVLHGTITDNETGQPVTDVRIEAGNFVTYSESNGYYRFSFIPEGSYNVVMFAPHYNFQIYKGLQIKADQPLELNISMKKNYQPVVYTGSASMITCHTAMFNGAVNPNGLNATAYFEYGPSQTYGKKTNSINAGNAWDPVSINIHVNQLNPETQYHFRLVAENKDGTTFGNDQMFATDVPILDLNQFQTIAIPSGNAIMKPFIIQNQGCGPLTYNISISDAVSISPDTNKRYSEIVIPEITEGTIDSGLTHTIPMTYTAKNLPYGTYQVTLTLQHNALNYPNPHKMTIPIKITSPKITVNPKAFNFVVQKGNIKKDVLTLGNSGNTDLTWRMHVAGGVQRNEYPTHYYETIGKDQIDNRMGRISANHFGGPDEFGYMWSDNFANDGPTYEWFEIARAGVKISDLRDDDYTDPIDIGFDFPFYGQNYDTFFVSSNGFIGFGETSDYANHTNMPVPSEQTPNNFIAPLWDDLSPENGAIYYYRQKNKLIVQFNNMKEYRNDGTATFQIIIEIDGTILFQYKSFTNAFNTNSCTTGIENNDGTDGLEVAFNMNYLLDKMAIRFEPNRCSWLKIYQSAEGYISPSQHIVVSIGVDTTNLILDHYQCNFIVKSDDLLNPEIIVPVHLDVVDAPPCH